MNSVEQYKEYLTGHINNVSIALELLYNLGIPYVQEHIDELREIVKEHDKSKYEEPEWSAYLHHFYPETEEDEMTDLTFMSGTALYSMVLNMVSDPVHYDGQTVRVRGYFAEGKDADGNTVYGCVIPDATACCQQGFLLNLTDTEYPESGQWFEVEGTFRYRLKEFSTDIILDDARIIRVLTD